MRPHAGIGVALAVVTAGLLAALAGPLAGSSPSANAAVTPQETHRKGSPAMDRRAANIQWAGVRSSRYGIDPFPTPAGWTKAMTTMSSYFDGSTPVAVWLAGEIEFDGQNSGQHFNFPNPGGEWDKTILFNDGEDQNEEFLDYFDEHGIKVWLQVEPGFSPIDQQIEILHKQYGDHPSVVGFGVDVEWYHSQSDGGGNDPVDDALAEEWDRAVKAVDPNWSLFLKHYDSANLPPNYRGDIIFIDDSEQNGSYDTFKDEMIGFAKRFAPNPVMFQIGYPSDKEWWSTLAEPIPQTIGKDLADLAPQENVGVVWVDFSLRDVLPTDG